MVNVSTCLLSTESKQRGENEVLRLCLQDVNQPLLGRRHSPPPRTQREKLKRFWHSCAWHSNCPSYTAASQCHQLYAYKDIHLGISQPSSLSTYLNMQEFFLHFTDTIHPCAAPRGTKIPKTWIKIDQLDVTCFIISLLLHNVFRMLVHPSSGACWAPEDGCTNIRNTLRTKWGFSLHKDTTPPQPKTPTHIEPEQHNTWNRSTISRKLLKMDALTFETCWALNQASACIRIPHHPSRTTP